MVIGPRTRPEGWHLSWDHRLERTPLPLITSEAVGTPPLPPSPPQLPPPPQAPLLRALDPVGGQPDGDAQRLSNPQPWLVRMI